ncbi:MAG: PKD domain-containing protein [Acidobacteriota bacterium]
MAFSMAKRGGFLVSCALAVAAWAATPVRTPSGTAEGLWRAFEPNLGQGPSGAAFVARSPGSFLGIGPKGVEVLLASPAPGHRPGREVPCGQEPAASFRLTLEGAAGGTFRPLDPLPGVVHLYRGSDPSRWITGIPRYGRLLWEGPIPGVDVEFFPLDGALRFDLHLTPGAGDAPLRLRAESLDGRPVAFRRLPGGEVVLDTEAGSLPLHLPAVFADGRGGRRTLRGSFVPISPRTLAVCIEGRREGEALVVDPTLEYSSYLGGSQYDMAARVREDGAGNLAVAGLTYSPDFPGGGTFHGFEDAFLAVFQGPSRTLNFVALLGGSGGDEAAALATDDGGNWILAGTTGSADFPVLGGLPLAGGQNDAFVARFTAGGALSYSTRLGGGDNEAGWGVAVGPWGRLYVTGQTRSSDFPWTDNAPQYYLGGSSDGFLTVLEPSLPGISQLVFSTFVGGTGEDALRAVQADPADPEALFLCGETDSYDFPYTPGAFQETYRGNGDGVFLRYSVGMYPGPTYATFLGGGLYDCLSSLAVLPNGLVAVAGYTQSPDFPTVQPTQASLGGSYDAVAAVFFAGPTATTAEFSTFLGGSGNDFVYAAAPCEGSSDPSLVVAGATSSADLPLLNPFPGFEALQGPEDALLAGWTFPRPVPLRTLTTYFGGNGDDWAEALFCRVDLGAGETRWGLAGGTYSNLFPLTGNAFQTTLGGDSDGFLSVVSTAPPGCTVSCSASAAPSNGIAPQAVAFTASATASGCSQSPSFFWDFGDGTTSTEKNPTHTYLSGGTYTWTLTVTADSETCTRSGEIRVCELLCSASASPASGLAPLPVSFTGGAALQGSCGIDVFLPAYDWDFGDGSAHSTQQNPSHTYTTPGSYTWTLTVSYGQAVCTRTGTVVVAQGSLWGYVGIQGDDLFPLDGEGIVSLSVTAREVSTGAAQTVSASRGFYAFPSLPAGTYRLEARVRYKDFILHDAEYRGFGCPAPPGGYLEKEVVRALASPVAVPPSGGVEADIAFPPPIVFLHGVMGCYRKWVGEGPGAGEYWDNRARAAGFFSFTPHYTWWGQEVSWDLRAGQVYTQIEADLHGLEDRAGKVLSVSPYPPWTLVAYDMGGLVARVLAGGGLGEDLVMRALQKIFLLAVPNSGSDFFFGGLGEGPLGTDAIVRRFNEVYPNFGPWTDKVYAIGGDRGLWGMGGSDGRVPLFSAFAIVRLLCGDGDPSGPRCRPYASVVFDSGPGHIFSYDHAELGSPPSATDVLAATILPRVGVLGPSPTPLAASPSAPAGDDENPLSPVGSSLWGTGARSTGTKGGTLSAFAGGPLATQSFDFPVGATDGMALAVFVQDGSASFTLLDPHGSPAASAAGENDLLFQVLNPEPGTWTLSVAVPAGSVTFRATSFENSPAGIEAHVTRDRYAPGEAVHYRLDLTGDPGDLAFTAVTAAVLSGGSLLDTVTLYDDGQHGDGAAGDGSFGGTGVAPSLPGAYDVLFTAQGTYDGQGVTRIARDLLAVLPPAHAFTGSFADQGWDTDDDGLYEALAFTANLDLPAAGDYTLSADLYDASDFFLAHASTAFTATSPGSATQGLLFDLSGAPCAAFGSPLAVRNLRLLEGGTLRPVDSWEAGVPTAPYPASAFDCQPAPPGPRLGSLRPDEGIQGRQMVLELSGDNFADGASVNLGEGVSVQEVSFLSPHLLALRVSIAPAAAPGPRTLTLANPGGAPRTLPGAFTVKADAPPSVVFLAPTEGYVVLGSAPLAVAAAASDDGAVAKVVFLVDGQASKEDLHHPFTFRLDPTSLPSGAHRVVARAYDDAGQAAEVSFLAVKDPPAITAVTKMAAPFRIKLLGQNFQAGARVYLGSDPEPWAQATVKNATTVVLKGGSALKAKFPKGQAVSIRLENPDGGYCTASYTRP